MHASVLPACMHACYSEGQRFSSAEPMPQTVRAQSPLLVSQEQTWQQTAVRSASGSGAAFGSVPPAVLRLAHSASASAALTSKAIACDLKPGVEDVAMASPACSCQLLAERARGALLLVDLPLLLLLHDKQALGFFFQLYDTWAC